MPEEPSQEQVQDSTQKNKIKNKVTDKGKALAKKATADALDRAGKFFIGPLPLGGWCCIISCAWFLACCIIALIIWLAVEIGLVEGQSVGNCGSTSSGQGCYKDKVEKIVNLAKSQLGKRYIRDAPGVLPYKDHPPNSPQEPKAFDCSKFTGWCIYWGTNGTINLPAYSEDQFKFCEEIPREQVQAGDLLIRLRAPGDEGHAALCISNTEIIHASSPLTGVKLSNIDNYIKNKDPKRIKFGRLKELKYCTEINESKNLTFPLEKKPICNFNQGTTTCPALSSIGRSTNFAANDYPYFGAPRKGNRKHGGVDLFPPGGKGAKVRAIKDGKVTKINTNFYTRSNGEVTGAIFINHGDFTILYGEVISDKILVKEGQNVKQGEIIGFISGTDQLHLEKYLPGVSDDKWLHWTPASTNPPYGLLDPTDWLISFMPKN